VHLSKVLSLASIVLGVLFYLQGVLGLLFEKATSPTDVGLVSTSALFVLFGLVGLMLQPRAATA